MIMESLGGDQLWLDRFFAQHCAVFYYWAIIGVFVFSPSLAYMFSELVEVATRAGSAAQHPVPCCPISSMANHAWLALLPVLCMRAHEAA